MATPSPKSPGTSLRDISNALNASATESQLIAISLATTSFGGEERFVYDPHAGFQVGIPEPTGFTFHSRTTPSRLRDLLYPRPPLKKVSNSLKKRNRSYVWWLSQLIHYGFPVALNKAHAQQLLKAAITEKRLKVPTHLSRLEARMKKECAQDAATVRSQSPNASSSQVRSDEGLLPGQHRSSPLDSEIDQQQTILSGLGFNQEDVDQHPGESEEMITFNTDTFDVMDFDHNDSMPSPSMYRHQKQLRTPRSQSGGSQRSHVLMHSNTMGMPGHAMDIDTPPDTPKYSGHCTSIGLNPRISTGICSRLSQSARRAKTCVLDLSPEPSIDADRVRQCTTGPSLSQREFESDILSPREFGLSIPGCLQSTKRASETRVTIDISSDSSENEEAGESEEASPGWGTLDPRRTASAPPRTRNVRSQIQRCHTGMESSPVKDVGFRRRQRFHARKRNRSKRSKNAAVYEAANFEGKQNLPQSPLNTQLSHRHRTGPAEASGMAETDDTSCRNKAVKANQHVENNQPIRTTHSDGRTKAAASPGTPYSRTIPAHDQSMKDGVRSQPCCISGTGVRTNGRPCQQLLCTGSGTINDQKHTVERRIIDRELPHRRSFAHIKRKTDHNRDILTGTSHLSSPNLVPVGRFHRDGPRTAVHGVSKRPYQQKIKNKCDGPPQNGKKPKRSPLGYPDNSANPGTRQFEPFPTAFALS